MRLIICGNGFDLHHKLKTGYGDYYKYLQSQSPQSIKDYEFLTKTFGNTGPWNNVESSLEINWTEYIEALIQHTESAPENERLYPDTYLEDELQFLFSFTGEYFVRWIENIDFSNATPDPALGISSNDLYINFNYTDTLQHIYGIPEDRILYIHGTLKNIDHSTFGIGAIFPAGTTIENIESANPLVRGDEISNAIVHDTVQFGGDMQKVAEMYAPARTKFSQSSGSYNSLVSKIDSIVSATTKDIYSNFIKLRAHLYNEPIDEVVIMGHSLSEPDIRYYSEVLIPCLKNARWTVTRHLDKNGRASGFSDKIALLEQMLEKKVTIIDW